MEAKREVQVELGSKNLTLLPDCVDIDDNLLRIDFDLAEAIDKTHIRSSERMMRAGLNWTRISRANAPTEVRSVSGQRIKE